jgi:CDP-diglyceride synthetase
MRFFSQAHWLAVFALAVGVLALLEEHFQFSRAATYDLRALFGLVATAGIAGVLMRNPGGDLFGYTRVVSRWVYISLYLLALVRVGVYISESPHSRPMSDFQFYILCCLLPLWGVRALVLTLAQ